MNTYNGITISVQNDTIDHNYYQIYRQKENQEWSLLLKERENVIVTDYYMNSVFGIIIERLSRNICYYLKLSIIFLSSLFFLIHSCPPIK